MPWKVYRSQSRNLVTVSKAVPINIPLADLLWGGMEKKQKTKNKKQKKKRKKSRVTSSFFNRGTVVIEADLISIAKTRRREGGCGMNREDRKFENVRVFE